MHTAFIATPHEKEGPRMDAAAAELLPAPHKEVQIKVPRDTVKKNTDNIGKCNREESDMLWNVIINDDLVAVGNCKRVDETGIPQMLGKAGTSDRKARVP